MIKIRLFGLSVLPLFILAPILFADGTDEPFMTLDEIRPGMTGEWRTVVSGTEIRSFPLEVIGVAWNAIAPGRSMILCKALDEENILSGPVGGMSGSPVYFDGRLAGAYAYGFTWPKEQAIIGVTPIKDMLEVFALAEGRGASVSSSHPARLPRQASPRRPLPEASSGPPGDASPDLLATYLQPLPTPLGMAGFSPRTLAEFSSHFHQLGLEPALLPMGQSRAEVDLDLQPGSAVAGVLLDGDFSIAGTGTVTYREGDHILAFGHPFFGMGPGEIPMAPAEILTVVRSVARSFKLSNSGPVIGTIYEDRLSAIAGEIGRIPPITRLTFHLENENGTRQTFRGNLFRHPQMSPLLSTVALADLLGRNMESADEQTFFLEARWEMEGFPPLSQRDAASGAGAPMRLAMQHMGLFQRLANNPFIEPELASVTYDIRFRDGWSATRLETARADRTTVKAGEEILLTVVTRDYRGEREYHRIMVPVPARSAPGPATLLIGDAASARGFDMDTKGEPADFGQFLDTLRRHRPRDSIYVKLLRPAAGLSVEGRGMSGLLPSATALLGSSIDQSRLRPIELAPAWETALPANGEFSGRQLLQIEIER